MTETSDVAIRAAGLSKLYKLYAQPSDLFWELISARARYRPFWALRDVSFEVKHGQVVGIMGRNGAGKSTLLKLITGTLERTEGDLLVNGRVSSILELGTGFNPEYSGRDNIYLGGLMVGMTRAEIKLKEAWIIEFSELEEFIDQPFKTYSTGMQARLTFATAVCVDPDILIVDEALSVGDARFQRKSFGKIEEFRKAGRTILLVSHDINTISTFCDHAILLERGEVIDQGEPYRIGQVYYKMLFSSDSAPSSSPAIEPALEDLGGLPEELELDPQAIRHESGFAYCVDLTDTEVVGDTASEPGRSAYILFEDDSRCDRAHSAHEKIREVGSGTYSHWGSAVYFSTADNSDPRINGRRYRLRRRDLVPLRDSGGETPDAAEMARRELREAALTRFGLRQTFDQHNSHQARMGNGAAEILDFGIVDARGERTTTLASGGAYKFFMKVLFHENVEGAVFGFVVRSLKGVDMFGTTTRVQQLPIQGRLRGELVEAVMDVAMWLTNGVYFGSFSVADPHADSDVQYDLRYDAYQFEVANTPGIFTTSMVNLGGRITVEEL
ncbi:MAG: ABC transporter ATP-binding protein [Thermoanaerobaculia bacterium]|nr:ABC transporter ATP-binding protein [Thermoanaerobaculia bacterium]